MAPDGFRLEESRPAVLDSSSVKQTWSVCETGHGVYGGLITRKSQEQTKDVYHYHRV